LAALAALALAGCASIPPSPPLAAAAPAAQALACSLPAHCVNSLGTGDLPPLPFKGTAAQGLAQLKATLAGIPQAQVVYSEGDVVQAIFTTPAGFRDQVDFRLDPAAHRIDFRSQSLIGLFDFGKNHSRMADFAERFAAQADKAAATAPAAATSTPG
jgi:uncharacterized protein (DUF1499 family)